MTSKRAALVGTALALGLAFDGAARAQAVSILYHERLASFALVAEPGSNAAKLTFIAFGRQFDIELAPNDSLASALPEAQRATLGDLQLYRGQLTGVAGSWARLARHGGAWSGAIWDGAELYLIDEFGEVAAQLVSPDTEGAGAPVIYRWSETLGLLIDALPRGDGAAPTVAVKDVNTVFESLKSAAGIWPGKQLDIALVADVEYATREGAQAEASLLSTLNVAEGIYISQVGVKLNAAEIEIFASETDPFTATDGSALLDELENHKDAMPSLRARGLAHLFTGRDIVGAGGAQYIGIANLGGLCDARLGTGITQATFGVGMNAVIFAHEVGHNFGAPHDNAIGSPCQSTSTGYIMAPNISGSQEFSACSVQQMLPQIAAATCLRDLAPANVTLRLVQPPPASVNETEAFGLRVVIENTGTTEAIGAEFAVSTRNLSGPALTLIGAPGGSRCFPGTVYRCVWPHFAPGTTMEAIFSFSAQTGGSGSIDISVSSLGEADTTNDTLHFDVNVVPRIDLAAALDPPGVQLHPGESANIRASVRNLGAFPATGVTAFLQVGYLAELVDSGLGACVWNGDTYLYGYDCAIGNLAAGEVRTFDVRVRSRTGFSDAELAGGTWLDLHVNGQQWDPASQNNRTSTRITLGRTIADVALSLSGPASLVVDAPFIYEVRVVNNGPDSVADVRIEHYELGLPLPRVFTAISSTLGTCTMQPPANDFVCRVPQLAAGASFTVTFAGTATAPGDFGFGVRGRSASPDWNANNDLVTAFPKAAPAPAPPSPPPTAPAPAPPPPPAPQPSGGGGGASDIAFAAILALALCLRESRRRKGQTHAAWQHARYGSASATSSAG